ncbi:MAG: glycosyltransferase family 87 protein [Verrucomicrobiota bacterium]
MPHFLDIQRPKRFPYFSFILLFWLVVWFYLCLSNAFQTIQSWEYGKDAGSDLKQHYTVALMLDDAKSRQEGYRSIYRDFHFSTEITKIFHEANYKKGAYLDRHNYRYGPLVAWLSQKSLPIPYNYWPAGWFMLSLLAASASMYLIRQFLDSHSKYNHAHILLFILAFPATIYTFVIYQNTLISLLLVCVSLYFLKKDKPWIAGIFFGLLFYKPQILVYAGAVMFLCGQWRFCLSAGVIALAQFLLSLLVCGVEANIYWVESILEIIRGVQGDEMQTNIPWKGFFYTVLPENLHTPARYLTYGLSLLGLCGTILFYYRIPKNTHWQQWHLFGLAVVYWLIFSPHVKAYELTLAIPLWLNARPQNALIRHLSDSLLWISALLGLFCRFINYSLAAPLLTIWILLMLYHYMESIKVFKKNE